ncbi:MAG TPA: GNAT family N-acetyltransferase [Candidatus Fournierella merdavium]|nr:GNAT family N-acetyltransferase [Candidatus Fournierella merdavium]
MDVRGLSSTYQVRRLTAQDADSVYELSIGNPLFYEYCPPHATREGIMEDMRALPPGKSACDKFYVGYFCENELIAIMDLIFSYPAKNTAWIGLFMMNQGHQHRGIGSEIIRECAMCLKDLGVEFIQLAIAKGNPQSEHFWRKNKFHKTGREVPKEGYTAVVMQRAL